MSGVSSSGDGSGVSFYSKTVGSFAVVSERTGLLPYQEWHVRPTGGQFGAEAMVAVQTSMTGHLTCNTVCLSDYSVPCHDEKHFAWLLHNCQMQVEVGSLLFVPPVVADLSEQNMHDIACCTEALFQRTLLCVLLITREGG